MNERHGPSGGTGHGAALWPVLLSLLVVLIPTACVLWFLNEAVHNQRLAARQELLMAYRAQLRAMRDRLEIAWRQQAAALDAAATRPGPAAFAACVRDALSDSVICRDASGRVVYPADPRAAPPVIESPAWTEAASLERARDSRAAVAYARAAQSPDDRLAALALQAQARCLARAGRANEAVTVLTEQLGQAKYARALDAEGRLIVADAQLRALELLNDSRLPAFRQAAERLARLLADYDTPPLGSAQRRFLAKELRKKGDIPILLENRDVPFSALLEAEELAAAYLDTRPAPADGVLRPSGLPGVWHFASPGGRVVALLRTASVQRRAQTLITADRLPEGMRVALTPPDAEPGESVDHLLPAGAAMPGWRLALSLGEHGGPSDARAAASVWIAVLVIGAMAIIAVLVGAAISRQMRLARLKNDLLATVSHELKTPLASMRLLVDTLLAAEQLDLPRTREYLELVSKENARLSRLIDNFLSFSRMERGKQVFEMADVRADEIMRRAVEAAGERFQAPGCRLEVAADPAPVVCADADALVTALLNLLDNAYKYSGDAKHVVVRTYSQDGQVCFAVQDNGIGLGPRALKKIFRPFYQVDRRLSRAAGGCGLGLSIVRSIAEAHGGSVRAESQPGQGSTFTLVIPRASP